MAVFSELIQKQKNKTKKEQKIQYKEANKQPKQINK